ncbi:threonine ammonia-lyase [bacterium]|nr:threonine ammonia-lyase [bacterium]
MKEKSFEVTLENIQDANKVLKTYLPASPLLRNSWLSDTFGCDLYLKLENMQPIGSFKIRGATYKISKLKPEERAKGVIAASAGNHAQGVAWGSKKLGTSALIVMPKSAPLMKIQNTKSLGAEVVLEGDRYDEAYAHAQELAKKTGRVFIHAFEDPEVIAGQGSIGLEILEQLPDVDVVVSAIGGGGLLAGTAIALKSLKPSVKTVGCQAAGADSMIRSIQQGKAITAERIDTFADGIAVAKASEVMRKILSEHVDLVVEESDEAIASSIVMLIEKAKIVAEGAGALPLAVLEKIRGEIRGKKVVVVVGGGNIDVNVLARIIDRGLIRAGRRLRINVLMSDRVGSLARLTSLIAQQGANIIQAIHDRSEPSTTIDLTEVALTLETRGPEHSQELIKALKEQVIRIELAH